MTVAARSCDKLAIDTEFSNVATAAVHQDYVASLHMPKLPENKEIGKQDIKTTSSFHSNRGHIVNTDSMVANTSMTPSGKSNMTPVPPSPSAKSAASRASALRSNTTIVRNEFMAGFDIRAEFTYQENRRVLGARRLSIVPQGSRLPDEFRRRTQRVLGFDPSTLTARLHVFFTRREVLTLLQKIGLMSAIMAMWSPSFETHCRLVWERRVITRLKIFHFCTSAVYAVLSMGQLASKYHVFLVEIKRSMGKMVYSFSKLTEIESLTDPTVRPSQAESWNPIVSPLWLILDMLALIGIIGEAMHLMDEPEGVPTPAQYLGLLNIFKIWRWLLPDPKRFNDVSTFWGSVLELFISLVLFTHIYACVFGFIATIETDIGRPTWADDVLLVEPHGCYDFYMAALYFSSYTVTSIGYGDICPANTFEQGVDALGMIISQMYLAKVFADLNFITSIHQHWQAEHHQRVTSTSAALDSMGMTGTLHDRVLAYQDFVWECQKEQTAKEILDGLSPLLKEEVKLIIHHRLVIQAPFLQKLSIRALRSIVASLTDIIYLPGDFIMRRGDLGSELYFLRDGCAAIFLLESAPSWHDSELKLLRRGDYFGEVAVLTGAPRSSWVMARTYCVCSVLQRKAIDGVMATEPTCISALARSMSNAMDLKRTFTWERIEQRIDEEFQDEEDLFRFLCSGEDGAGPAGLVTWARYQMLMHRLVIPILDQKLLWVELDTKELGEVDFSDLVDLMEANKKPAAPSHDGAMGSMPDGTRVPTSEGLDGTLSGKTSEMETSAVERQLSEQTNSPTNSGNRRRVYPKITRMPTSRMRRNSGCLTSPSTVLHEPLTLLQHRVDELASRTEDQFRDLRCRVEDIARHLGVRSSVEESDTHTREPQSPVTEALLQAEGSFGRERS